MMIFWSLYLIIGIIIVMIHDWAQESLPANIVKQYLTWPMKIYIILFWFPLLILNLLQRLKK